jgi:hypothetical protein
MLPHIVIACVVLDLVAVRIILITGIGIIRLVNALIRLQDR